MVQAEVNYGAPKSMCFPGQLRQTLAAVSMRGGLCSLAARGRMRASVLSPTGSSQRALLPL